MAYMGFSRSIKMIKISILTDFVKYFPKLNFFFFFGPSCKRKTHVFRFSIVKEGRGIGLQGEKSGNFAAWRRVGRVVSADSGRVCGRCGRDVRALPRRRCVRARVSAR